MKLFIIRDRSQAEKQATHCKPGTCKKTSKENHYPQNILENDPPNKHRRNSHRIGEKS